MSIIEWACEVENKVIWGCCPNEKPPLIFTHWIALFILLAYSLLYRLGIVSEEE